MARPSAGSRFAAHVTGGLIRAAGNTQRRRDELKLQAEKLALAEREMELRERQYALDQRDAALKQQSAFMKDLDLPGTFQKFDQLQGQAQAAGVHRLAGMAEKPTDTPTVKGLKAQYRPADYGVPQGPGLQEALRNVGSASPEVIDPREAEMKDLEYRAKKVAVEKAEKDAQTGWMTAEQKQAAGKEAAWFPPDPNQSMIYEPLLAAVQAVANEGSNPMHADFPSKLYAAVAEKLKEMEGTVTPDAVAKAAQYIVKNMEAFGGFTPKKEIPFWRDTQPKYIPPGAAPDTTAAKKPRGAVEVSATEFPEY